MGVVLKLFLIESLKRRLNLLKINLQKLFSFQPLSLSFCNSENNEYFMFMDTVIFSANLVCGEFMTLQELIV